MVVLVVAGLELVETETTCLICLLTEKSILY